LLGGWIPLSSPLLNPKPIMSNNKRTQSDAKLDDVDILTKMVKELENKNEGLKDDKKRLTLEIKDLKDKLDNKDYDMMKFIIDIIKRNPEVEIWEEGKESSISTLINT
jgi:hypothetical protein